MFRKTLRKIAATLTVLLAAVAIPLLLPLLIAPSSDDITNHIPIIAVPFITLLSLLMAFFSAPIIYMPTFGIIIYFTIKKWSKRQERKQATALNPRMSSAVKPTLNLANSYLFTGAVAELVLVIIIALVSTTANITDFISTTLAMPSIAALVSLAIINFSIAKYQSNQQSKAPLTKLLFISALIVSLAPTIAILIVFGKMPAEYYGLIQPFITISTLAGSVVFLTMAFIWYSYTKFISNTAQSYNIAGLYRIIWQNDRNIVLLSIAYCAVCVYVATNIFDRFDWSQLDAYLPLIHNLIISCPGLLVVLINLPILCVLLYFWQRKLKQASTASTATTSYNLLASTMNTLSFVLLFIPLISASAIVPILIAHVTSKEALKEDSADAIAHAVHSLGRLSVLLYVVELAITVLYFKTVV